MSNWHPQVEKHLSNEEYSKIADFYENLVAKNPEEINNYWYLGLAYLLQEKEQEAQTTWFYVFTHLDEKEIKNYTDDLINILDYEAQIQQSKQNYRLAWLSRKYIKEICPNLLNNLLSLVDLEINLNIFTFETVQISELINLINNSQKEIINLELLFNLIPKLLLFAREEILLFVEKTVPYIDNINDLINSLQEIIKIIKTYNASFAIKIHKLCLKIKPDDFYVSKNLFWDYLSLAEYEKAYQLANQMYQQSNDIAVQVFTNYQIVTLLLQSGNWLEIEKIAQRHKKLLKQTIAKNLCPRFIKDGVLSVAMPLLYLEDNPRENRYLQNQIAKLYQEKTRQDYGDSKWWLDHKINNVVNNYKLKIGYIGHTFRKHSVGLLSRWLFKYINRDKFEISLYLLNQIDDDITNQYFHSNVDYVNSLSLKKEEIAEKIWSDKIDILIDLDSLTNIVTCQIMSFKAAPIQVTWLGLDASGIPAIDYFIADPYVLPENAQDYYQEKIWRFPQTYIAVDGFEVGIPSLDRVQLGISNDAIIYLTAQPGLKRHPQNIRLQMQVLKEVTNSYLLVKGIGDPEKIKALFYNFARQENINLERIKFLSRDKSEEIHRANLQIADVVLDTYPYNGATTTLETLWMGIPLVTRVGDQFAARNSYSFMRNVGVTEGIARSDREYVEWGVRLGTDEPLRQKITWQLRKSRHTSPLWNGKQFTREMEKAYQKMWQIYLES